MYDVQFMVLPGMCGGFEWKTVHQTLKHTRNLILWSKLFLVRRYRGVHVWKLSQIQTDIRIGCALNMRERRRKCNKARRRRGEKKIIADGITSAENQDQDAMLWYCMGKTESMSKSWVFLLFYFPLCEWWNIRDTYWNHSATDTLDAVVFCCSLFFGESAVIFYEISLPFASVLRTKRTVFSLENGISIWTTTTKPNQFLAHRNRNQIDWESLKIGLPLVISLKPGKVAKLVTHCHSRYFDRKVNAEGDFVESFCRLLTENALTLKWLSQANCRFHVVPS